MTLTRPQNYFIKPLLKATVKPPATRPTRSGTKTECLVCHLGVAACLVRLARWSRAPVKLKEGVSKRHGPHKEGARTILDRQLAFFSPMQCTPKISNSD